MQYRTSFLVATTALFPATASFAEVTPQEVWDQFLVSAQISGQTWTAANLEQNGDTLIAQDVSLAMPIFGDFMTVDGTIPQVVMQQLNDGTVKMTIPDPVDYSVSVEGELDLGLERMDVISTMTMDNVMIASGTAEDLTLEIQSGTLTYVTPKQVKDGLAIVPEQTITLLGLKGLSTQKTAGTDVTMTVDISAEAATVVSDGTTDELTMETSYKMAPLSLTSNVTSNLDALGTPLGFIEAANGSGSYAIENMAFEMKTGTAAQMMHLTGETEAATVGADLSDGSLTYTGTSANTEMVVSGSAIPFPQIDLGLEAANFALTMPFLASEEKEEFGLKLELANLRLPEIAWMILDPSAQMAHDPATLKLDISGDTHIGVNLLDFKTLVETAESGTLPFVPADLKLNDLFLSIAGATLTGQGEAMFVAPDEFIKAELPFKTAEATLSLTGGTALIDTLTQTGLLPPQTNVTAKMMLGMFARPGEGDDAFITDIKLNETGMVTLNGQPMPF